MPGAPRGAAAPFRLREIANQTEKAKTTPPLKGK